MQVSLLQRCCWWWWMSLVSLASAATGQEHCEVLDLSLQPSAYPLPTNLTVRPSATGWHLNFTLQEKGAPPAACVRLKETESKVQVMLFKGDCVHGKLKKYNYLPRASVPPHTWTTLALDVKDNIVLVAAPGSDPVPLKAKGNNWLLPHDTLQVTMTHDVEAAVGCYVNCPLYRRASEGPDVKKKVWEHRQEKLHFYFRPGTAFDKVHYEVVCKTRKDSEFRRGVDIQPGKDGAAGAWHQVDLEQQESTAKVYLNDKLLEEIQLPDSCTTNIHTVWTIGNASFGFDCKAKQMVEEKEPDPVTEDTANNLMHPAVSAGMTAAVLIPIVICLVIYIRCRRSQPQGRNPQPVHQYSPPQYQNPQYSLRSFPPVTQHPPNWEDSQYYPMSLPPTFEHVHPNWKNPQHSSKSFPPGSGFSSPQWEEPPHNPAFQSLPPHREGAKQAKTVRFGPGMRPSHIQTSDDVLSRRFGHRPPHSTETEALLKAEDEGACDGDQ